MECLFAAVFVTCFGFVVFLLRDALTEFFQDRAYQRKHEHAMEVLRHVNEMEARK